MASEKILGSDSAGSESSTPEDQEETKADINRLNRPD